MQKVFKVSERKACKVIDLNRTALRYKAKRDNSAVKALICELSEKHPRYGYRKIYDMLKIRGVKINKETVRIIRKAAGLQVVRKQRKKRNLGKKHTLKKAEHIHHVWSWDFMFDVTVNGRKLKILNIIDEFSRECLASYCARTITARDVFRILQKLFFERGLPAFIRSDNGPEFVAKYIQAHLSNLKIEVLYIEPGSPWQNAYIESFNSILRDSLLNRCLFATPKEAQMMLDEFKIEYNTIRPHGSLNGVPPSIFVENLAEIKKCA